MTEVFVNQLYATFRKREGYVPYEFIFETPNPKTGMMKVIKKEKDGFIIVDLVDASQFSFEEIEMNINRGADFLYETNNLPVIHTFKVLVFDKKPDLAMTEMMMDRQFNDPARGRYYSFYLVVLEEKKVFKLFESFIESNQIDGVLEEAIQSFEASPDTKGLMDSFGTNFVLGKGANRKVEFVGEGMQAGSNADDFTTLIRKRKEADQLTFFAERPVASYTFIVLNVLIFIAIDYFSGYMTSSGQWNLNPLEAFSEMLNLAGDKDNARIISGEYWRFLTPVFLHASIPHLLFNSYAIYTLTVVEKLFGNLKYLYIYLLAGIMGNVASFAFSDYRSVGASGAVFGLLGAMLYYGQEKPGQFKKYFSSGIIYTLIINVIFGLTAQRIDNFAHMGGLLGGFLAAGTVRVFQDDRKRGIQIVFILATIVCIGAGVLFGMRTG